MKGSFNICFIQFILGQLPPDSSKLWPGKITFRTTRKSPPRITVTWIITPSPPDNSFLQPAFALTLLFKKFYFMKNFAYFFVKGTPRESQNIIISVKCWYLHSTATEPQYCNQILEDIDYCIVVASFFMLNELKSRINFCLQSYANI